MAKNNDDVGFAMNWMDQGWYMTKKRMEENRDTAEEIDKAYHEHLAGFRFLKTNPSYSQYQERYRRKKDFKSEDHDHLMSNVQNTQNVLRRIFNTQTNLYTIPDATHGLLRHPQFNTQNPGFWCLLRLLWEGENAYAGGFLEKLDGWLNKAL